MMKTTTTLALVLFASLAHAAAPTGAPAGWERKLIAAVIIGEGGGEGKAGMKAIYEVIWQRGVQRKRSLAKVVTRRKQFSCLNRTTPAAQIARAMKHPSFEWVHDELLKHPPLTVSTVRDGLPKVTTNRADHYHTTRVRPSWARGKRGKRIGNHLFYKLN